MHQDGEYQGGGSWPDHPGVLVLPTLLATAVLALGIVLDALVPLQLKIHIPELSRVSFGVLLVMMGVALPVRARLEFGRVGTNIPPTEPATALATGGIYSRTRNPMYTGGAIALAGLAMILASDWMLILLVPALLILHFGVVLREERYLERKFGDAYRRYCEQVPRYGWRL
jgi:protein-S-isoprenylcysteine O-methyltransferase Ste14